jgi:hypothetical protein
MKLNACILLLAHMVYLKPKPSLGYYYIQTFKQLFYAHIQFVTQVISQLPVFAPLAIPR